MEIRWSAILRAIHVHRRDDDTVLQRHSTQREGSKHGRRSLLQFASSGATRKPALHASQVSAIAQAQILMANALAASEQAICELLRIKMNVSLHILKPFHGVTRGILQS